MTIYLILLITIVFFSIPLFDKRLKGKYKKTFIIIAFSLMILLLGLRGRSVGEDTNAYMSIFNKINNTNWGDLFKGGLTFSWTQWGEDVEILFAVLYKLISVFTNESQYALFITALLTYSLIARFIYKNCSDHLFFATIIILCNGVFMSSFNACRQMLALAIAINSYDFMKDKKYYKCALIFVISSLVHMSSIILLPILIISLLNDRRKIVITSTIIASVMAIFVPLLSNIVTRLFPIYSVYLESAKWNVSLGGTLFLWIFELFICFMLFTKGIKSNFELLGILGVLFSISFSIASMSVPVFSRVTIYFSFFNVVLFPLFGDRINNKHLKIVYHITTFVLITLQYISASSVPSRDYMFFWQ